MDPMFLFVVPGRASRTTTIDPRWLAVADFAAAIGARAGGVEVLTSDGLMTPADIRRWAFVSSTLPSRSRSAVRRLPSPARSLIGDLTARRRARSMRSLESVVRERPYRFVVQLHRRFADVGPRIARSKGVPSVLRVEALEVREEALWGLPRPGFGGSVERAGETSILRKADLVAPVSDDLREQIIGLGVRADRVVTIPNGVDLELFAPGPGDEGTRRRLGLQDRFIVGWVGSFRPFHGLEMLRRIGLGLRDRVPNAVVCLIGTGPLHERVVHEVAGLERWIKVLDPVPHDDVPDLLRTFDAGLLMAGGEAFHYSPLKLFEYLAAGCATVAPRVGQVAEVLRGEEAGLLVPPGDPDAIVHAIARLDADPALRARLATNGRRLVEQHASWDARACALLDSLGSRDLVARGDR